MGAALDTNVLAYAEGVNGSPKKETALAVLHGLPLDSVVVPVQVLGELFRVLVRKAGRTCAEGQLAIMSWRDAYPVLDTSASTMMDAAGLAADHRLSIWDAVVLAAAAEGGARLLLSEDFQDGFS